MYNIVEENIILNNFFGKTGKLKTSNVVERLIAEYNLSEYISNRYDDSDSVKETLIRIRDSVDVRPVCKICGKQLKFNIVTGKFQKTYCSVSCSNKDDEKKEKIKGTKFIKYGDAFYNNQEKRKATCIEKYGVENYTELEECKEKMRQTNLKRYGKEYVLQLDFVQNESRATKLRKYGDENYNNREKAEKTTMNRYGVKNTKQVKSSIEKERDTCLKKYGVTSYRKTIECEIKIRKTNLKKYGVEHCTKSKEWIDKWYKNKEWLDSRNEKIIKTKKEHHSFNLSKPEKIILNELKKKFADIVYQYKDDRYPYICDYYIPQLDTFIEYNGHWTHGPKPYNNKDEECINLLNKWKNKQDKKIYRKAIEVWTERDVKKAETAKKNHLKYIVLYYNDFKNIDNVISMIEKINEPR